MESLLKEYKMQARSNLEKAEAAAAERQELENRSLGPLDYLTPGGRERQKRIAELRRQEKGARLEVDSCNSKIFFTQERLSTLIDKENSRTKPERSERQVEKDINTEAKRRQQDTAFGRMCSVRQKMQETTDPLKKAELQKELEFHKSAWEKECNDKVAASQGSQAPEAERER